MPFEFLFDGSVRRFTVLAPPDWMSVVEFTGTGLPLFVFAWPGRVADLEVPDGMGGLLAFRSDDHVDVTRELGSCGVSTHPVGMAGGLPDELWLQCRGSEDAKALISAVLRVDVEGPP